MKKIHYDFSKLKVKNKNEYICYDSSIEEKIKKNKRETFNIINARGR